MGADLGIVFTTEEGSQSGLISVKSKIQGNIPLTLSLSLSLSPSALSSELTADHYYCTLLYMKTLLSLVP